MALQVKTTEFDPLQWKSLNVDLTLDKKMIKG